MVGEAEFRQAEPLGRRGILAGVALGVFAEGGMGVIIRSHEIF